MDFIYLQRKRTQFRIVLDLYMLFLCSYSEPLEIIINLVSIVLKYTYINTL